jgi:hypothetical protein
MYTRLIVAYRPDPKHGNWEAMSTYFNPRDCTCTSLSPNRSLGVFVPNGPNGPNGPKEHMLWLVQ